MNTETEKEILKAIEENDIQNYIDNHYWEIRFSTLVDLLKEVLFLLPAEYNDALITNLTEYRDFGKE